MWKSIVLSVFLHSKRFMFTLNDGTTYGEFLLGGKPKHFSNYTNNGCDNRYNLSSNALDNEVILNITKFHMQMELLKKLENTFTPIPDKLKHIDQYNKIFKDSSISNNLKAGDLFKDWTIEF